MQNLYRLARQCRLARRRLSVSRPQPLLEVRSTPGFPSPPTEPGRAAILSASTRGAYPFDKKGKTGAPGTPLWLPMAAVLPVSRVDSPRPSSSSRPVFGGRDDGRRSLV